MVSARADPAAWMRTSAPNIRPVKPRISALLFELCRDLLGVLLVTLEDLQAGLQQLLQFGVARRRDERLLQRAVDGLMVGDLVLDVGLVESGAAQLGELVAFFLGLFGQRLAGVVVLRRDLQLLDQRQCLVVDRLVVALHVLGEGANLLVLALRQRLLGGVDIELARRVGDVRDLRIGRFGALRRRRAGGDHHGGKRAGYLNELHYESPFVTVTAERPWLCLDRYWMRRRRKGSRNFRVMAGLVPAIRVFRRSAIR